MTETPLEKLKRLAGMEKPVQKDASKENPIIQKSENGIVPPQKVDRRHFNIRTPGTGRKLNEVNAIKRASQQKADEFIHGNVRVQVTDPKTRRSFIVNKPRLVRAAEALYKSAVENEDVSAQKEFLNRGLGKVPDTMEGGDPNKPVRIIVDF